MKMQSVFLIALASVMIGSTFVSAQAIGAKAGTYQLKAEEGNLLVDPLIVEFEKGAVRFAPDSPAGKLGIKPIDVSGAGRRPWIDSAKRRPDSARRRRISDFEIDDF
jgi:hypothetical protein